MSGQLRTFQGCILNNVSIDDYKEEEMFLEEKFKISRTISGTQKLHCFIVQCNKKVLTKVFSNLSSGKPERLTVLTKEEILLDEIKG